MILIALWYIMHAKNSPNEDPFFLKAKRGRGSNTILGQTEGHHFWPFQKQTLRKMLDLMLTKEPYPSSLG